jgi:hypothetical protein
MIREAGETCSATAVDNYKAGRRSRLVARRVACPMAGVGGRLGAHHSVIRLNLPGVYC